MPSNRSKSTDQEPRKRRAGNQSYDLARYDRSSYASGERSNRTSARRPSSSKREYPDRPFSSERGRGSNHPSNADRYGRASYNYGRVSERPQQRNDRSARVNGVEGKLNSSQNTQIYSRKNSRYTSKNVHRDRNVRRILIGILIVALTLLICGGLVFAKFVKSVDSKLQEGKTEEELLAIQDSLVPRYDDEAPFYIMLIGSDRRADDEDMGARSDTNIVARVDPATNTVTLISIPRDTKINLPGYGTQKFNAAYSYKSTAGAIQAASDLLGVDISHYAEINFESMITLIDELGGVEVYVPTDINDGAVLQEGLQTLSGEGALGFARSRAYEDGDITRTSNQRLLIEAIINKILSLPAERIPGVVLTIADCVSTDLTTTEILSLAMRFSDVDSLTIYSCMVPCNYDGSYLAVSQTALTEMMEIIEMSGDPSTLETTAITGSSLNQ